MATGFSVPLLELFRRGEVDREVRLLAARGELAPRPHEHLGLLMHLAGDADAEIARTAESTLRAMPAEVVAQALAAGDATEDARAFLAARGIQPAAAHAGEPAATSDERTAGAGIADDSGAQDDSTLSVVQRLAGLTVAQRVVRAMKGTREERAILVRDPNRIVNAAVLSSPKLSDSEVEMIARMANVSEDVLRTIGRTKAWMKNYATMVAVAKNPKTPVAQSMNLLPRLMDKDVKMISIDRNVPDVLRTSARRRVVVEK